MLNEIAPAMMQIKIIAGFKRIKEFFSHTFDTSIIYWPTLPPPSLVIYPSDPLNVIYAQSIWYLEFFVKSLNCDYYSYVIIC